MARVKTVIAWVASSVALVACGGTERAPSAPSGAAAGAGATAAPTGSAAPNDAAFTFTGPVATEEDAGAPSGRGAALREAAKVVASLSDGMARCYDAGLAKDPTMAGKLRVEVLTDAEGTPTSTKVLSPPTKLASDVVDCITGLLAKARFPGQGKPGRFVVPLNFQP
jgi:hypothetical protein